jgi:hypothetical protein
VLFTIFPIFFFLLSQSQPLMTCPSHTSPVMLNVPCSFSLLEHCNFCYHASLLMVSIQFIFRTLLMTCSPRFCSLTPTRLHSDWMLNVFLSGPDITSTSTFLCVCVCWASTSLHKEFIILPYNCGSYYLYGLKGIALPRLQEAIYVSNLSTQRSTQTE